MAERRTELLTVQALRAIAALLVVAYHAVGHWGAHVRGEEADAIWGNGAAGVDVFFVISGLVMVISASRLHGRAMAGWVFLRHRLTRIVPMYWIVTTAKIAAVLAMPALVARTHLDTPYVIGSYLLLPVHDASGHISPVLPVGWTLTYEMMFYLLVTLALAIRVPLLRIAVPALLAFSALAVFAQPGWPPIADFANTIVLEFLAGVLIGMAIQRDRIVPEPLGWVLLLGGFAALLLMPVGSGVLRPLTWGVPAAAIVLGAVGLEHRLASRLPRWLLAAGDASYSTYLTHGFVVPLVGVLVLRAGLAPAPALAVLIAASVVLSAVVGQASYIVLERPLLHLFRRRRAAPAVVVAG
ncbi:MAG: acyltransferase [Rhodospirillales bacterium]|nr:acyltransferase [Rhodospirillales bacterium]